MALARKHSWSVRERKRCYERWDKKYTQRATCICRFKSFLRSPHSALWSLEIKKKVDFLLIGYIKWAF